MPVFCCYQKLPQQSGKRIWANYSVCFKVVLLLKIENSSFCLLAKLSVITIGIISTANQNRLQNFHIVTLIPHSQKFAGVLCFYSHNSVSNQTGDKSVLAQTRQAIAIRRMGLFNEPGNVLFLNNIKDTNVIAYVRTDKSGRRRVLCAFNFGNESVEITYKKHTLPVPAEDAVFVTL